MIRRTSPLLQMTLALVSLCGMLILLADVLFGLFPDRDAQTLALRKGVAETMAAQVATLVRTDDPPVLRQSLETLVQRTPALRSVAIRMADGRIRVQVGDHEGHWRSVTQAGRSDGEHLTVALNQGEALWGSLEMAYAPSGESFLMRHLASPLGLLMIFLSLVGTLVFGLYLRRALQHLDPASVIPERVQGAFDAMHEGVVVLDVRGRILLANRAFRVLHPGAERIATGQDLSAQQWLCAGLPEDSALHPWARAMAEKRANAGLTLEVGQAGDGLRRLVINASPIADPGGQVRGCLATLSDVSDLHRANEALRGAMADLSRIRDEMARKNVELEFLSTRDPLSGCLNRRALFAAAEELLARARRTAAPVACLMIDIDHFKRVNDSHGHGVGDRVIEQVARQLQLSAGADAVVGRYGGEEFCVILPGRGRAAAWAQAEEIRLRIADGVAPAIPEAAGLRVTVSIGLSTYGGAGAMPGLAAMMEHADQGLYQAKHGGRNRVCHGDAAPTRRTASATP